MYNVGHPNEHGTAEALGAARFTRYVSYPVPRAPFAGEIGDIDRPIDALPERFSGRNC